MSFSGDLEHLPIVDVIQLLHSTRKTGTLFLESNKRESQLVFRDGYFISANHPNNSVRVGQILVEMKTITHDDLELALLEQQQAGPNRKPLIATLLEKGKINEDNAYQGLEALIEMTIVEVLTWTSGTFSLDVTKTEVSDEFRYFPETLKRDIYMNAQGILMDALRIYDEKMHDGTLTDLFFAGGETIPEEPNVDGGENLSITADMLGLDSLDELEKKIPDVFTGIKEFAPADAHRQVIEEVLGDIPQGERERLCGFLSTFSSQAASAKEGPAADEPALAVILYSRDRFITHAITASCRRGDRFVFSTDDEVNLDPIIVQSLSKGFLPVLVLDAPDMAEEVLQSDYFAGLQEKRKKYPRIAILQLVIPREFDFSLHALQAGVRAVLPRPDREGRKSTFVDDTIAFLTAFHSYLRTSISGSEQQILSRFKRCFHELDNLTEVPELVFALLNFASCMFERAITFVVGKTELIAEKGIGVRSDKCDGPSPPMMFRIPLDRPSVFQDVVDSGRLYFGQGDDAILREHLFAEIGAPSSPQMLLLPIHNFGRVIACIYADFGTKGSLPVQIELLDFLARHAGLLLDAALYRKRFDKTA